VVRDSGGDVYRAIRAARHLLVEDRVGSIVGPLLSETTLGAAAVAEALGAPLLTPTATGSRLPEIGGGIFQLNSSTEAQGRRMGAYAGRGLLCGRVAVVHPRTTYGETIAQAFRESFEAAGGEIVTAESFPSGATEFEPIVLRLKELRPDGIYLPTSPAAVAHITPLLLFHDVHAALLGANGWSEESVRTLGDQYVGGAVFTTPFHASSRDPATRRFVARYEALWGEAPGLVAAATHDAVRSVVLHVREGAEGPADLRARLAEGRPFRGTTGPLQFDEEGRAVGGAQLVTIHRNRVLPVAPLRDRDPLVTPRDPFAEIIGG
jgi:branched-chain amino acid transport system substrate-binding protein